VSLACFRRKSKIERQVFHLTLFLSFGRRYLEDTNHDHHNLDFSSAIKRLADYAYNIPVNWTLNRRVLGGLLLGVSLAALAWGLWPLPDQARSLAVSPQEMLPVELGSDPALAGLSAVAEPRLLLLVWPSIMRLGDLAEVQLQFGPAEPVDPPEPALASPGEPYSVLAEARLDLPGLPHSPPGEISQALTPGRSLAFVWDLLPVAAGETAGTVWLHLRYTSTTRPELRQVLTAQRIQIRSIDFLGLSGPWARALGSAGVVVGAVLCLDGVVLWLWSRLERKSGV